MGSFEYSLILLICAILVVVLFRRLNLPPILGYIFVGALLGDGGFKIFHNNEHTQLIGEFGVVFLMFTIGLEFSFSRLIAMRKALLGLGGVQVVLCTGITAFATALLTQIPWKTALVAAGALALSSTAVVIKQLQEQRELHSIHGRLSVSILIFQDLAAVFFMILIPAIAVTNGSDNLLIPLLSTFLKGAFVFVILSVLGIWVLRPLFHEVAKAHSNEIFILTALFVVLIAAWITQQAHLSMSLGAFLSGLLLGETKFRHQIEIDIRPFRDILLGFFFISVGLLLKLDTLLSQGHWIALLLLALLVSKTLIIMGLTYYIGQVPWTKAFRIGLILAQGGEFGFVVLNEAIHARLIDARQNQVVVSAVVLSIVLAPLLIRYNRQISEFLFPSAEKNQGSADTQQHDLLAHASDMENHVIICGFGRVGQVLARFLEQERIPCMALDLDPMRISKSSMAGENSFYGDAKNPSVLLAAGIQKARMLVISFLDEEVALETLKHVRNLRSDIPVFVRTKDDSKLEAFQAAGATEVVPETLEASLMLASHLLLTLGVPASRILYKVRAVHADRYRILQGFFKGQDDLDETLSSELRDQELYAITIPENAFAVGKLLGDLLPDDSIPIKSVTRNNLRYPSPSPDWTVEVGDTLVIFGDLEDLYVIEERILKG